MRKDTTVKLGISKPENIKETEETLSEPRCYGLSDIGKVRGNNEDSFAIVAKRGYCIFGVFDGMGGMERGEVASSIAKEELIKHANQSEIADEKVLNEIFERANEKIYSYSKERGIEGKMGTTGVIAIVKNGTLYYGNVGDSRLYVLRDGKLIKATHDHTLVAMQVEQGIISKKDAEKSKLKNILTKAIGVKSTVQPEFYAPMKLKEGDTVLLCSDGLYNMANEKEIVKVLSGALTLKEKAEKLIKIANKHGGKDNITVVIYENKNKKSVRKSKKAFLYITLLIIAAIATVLFVIYKPLIMKFIGTVVRK